METGPRLSSPKHARKSSNPAHTVMRLLSWVGVGVCLITAASAFADYDRSKLPGASETLFWTCLGMAAVCALLLSPPVFKKLPPLGRAGGLILTFALLVTVANERQTSFQAYMRAPAGKAEQAKVDSEAEREATAARAAEQKRVASPEYAAQQAANKAAATAAASEATAAASEKYDKDLEACFSFFGHSIPKLTSQVKDSMNNPSAFEYVSTEKVGDMNATYNVELTFRAQNGFGAIRTASVRAKINPADCSVEDVDKIAD